MTSRLQQGIETGHLRCGRCRETKPVAGFHKHIDRGWSSWCRECKRAYKRSTLRDAGKRYVAAPLHDSTISYLMDEMLPDGMRRNVGGLVAKLIEDHVAAHRRACKQIATKLPTNAGPGWPTKDQMMGKR